MVCGGTFSIKTTAMIAVDMIRCLKGMHELGFVYRDLKPSNLCIGYTDAYNLQEKLESNKVYCVDFGLCTEYMYIYFLAVISEIH